MKTLHFQSTIVDSEKVNPLFTKVRIHVAYEGENRNKSYISRETFEKASESAKFCPIVGEWSEPIEDFLGHGGKIEIKDDAIKFVRTTIPYGCISNEEPIWETVENEDGTVSEYFTLTGYVWSSRFPELETILDNQKNHSMEVEILSGGNRDIEGKKLYAIDEMIFSGFCILGDNTEPCFENSTISTYSLNKDKFKQEFKQMIAELKFSLKTEDENKINNHALEGGNKMPENNKDVIDFTLTSEQLENELKRELAKSMTDDQWGYSYQDYYFVDYMSEQNIVIAMDSDDRSLVGLSYTMEGDSVTVDFSTEKRFKVEYVPMDVPPESEGLEFNLITNEQMDYKLKIQEKETESKIVADFEVKVSEFETKINEFESRVSEKETELTDLQTQFEVIKQEKEELETFKLDKLKSEKEIQINAIFESVTSELSDEELVPFKEKAFEMEVDELRKELFSLIGQKAFEAKSKFSTNKNKSISMSIVDDIPKDTTIANTYDSIIKKYNKLS